MKTLREIIREHQQATDTNDSTMLNLVCQWIDNCGPDLIETDTLIDFIQENLERGPGDIPVAPWRTDLFTEADRTVMMTKVMEEIADCGIKDLARIRLEDEEDLIECIGYVDPDPEETCRVLYNLSSEAETLELIRQYPNPGWDSWERIFNFAVRMGLIYLNAVTYRGREYMERFL